MQHIQHTRHSVLQALTLLFLTAVIFLCTPLAAHAGASSQAPAQSGSQVLTTQSEAGKVAHAVAAIIVGDEPTAKGETQTVGIVLNDETATMTQGQLFATNIASNKLASTTTVKVQDNMAVFTFKNLPDGTYYVSQLRYSLKNAPAQYEQSFAMDEANTFTVSSVGARTITGDDVTVSVYDLDETGSLADTTALATTVQQASAEALESGLPATPAAPARATQEAAGPVSTWAPAKGADPLAYKFVIAIDPGHGGSDAGAAANGLQEKDINLKIAKACADELKKYQNIEVFLTRTTDVYVGLNERVATAKNKGARVFVSIHINAAGGASAKGTEVYYPIGSAYLKNQTHGMGKVLAQDILDELLGLGLGLTSRGIVTRETTVDDTYADGSKSDYYSAIHNSRARGIPGLIVEHAFITNAAEAKIMKSDANLTKMGKADAAGIAKAYNFATGYWYKDNGTWKYWDGSKYVTSKWLYRAGTWYYFNANEQPVSGLQKINGAWYYFDKTTYANTSGWIKDGGKWYYGRSDNAIKESWSLKPGWLKLDAWYYFDPATDGHPVKTGLFTVDGVQYYADGNGRMAANKDVTVNGVVYHAAASGALTKKGSAQAVATQTPSAQTVTTQITDAKMAGKTGWVQDGAGWHYYKNGKAQSGWIKLKGAWYYLDPNIAGHPAKTGFFSDGKARYYCQSGSCAMKTGWVRSGDAWYYFKASGAMAYGWQKVGGTWYYLDKKTGVMAANEWIDGWWLSKSGAWKYKYKGSWRENATGWWYGDTSGWYAKDNKQKINGVAYRFDARGYWIEDKAANTTQATSTKAASTTNATGKTNTASDAKAATEDYDIMGKPGTTVAKMVAAYNKTGNAYPAAAYKTKGAATINDFCQILYEEATAEGVRPEVVFAQSMLETGWLQFGGAVEVGQCNFAGIGATDSGGKPATFKDVREGLRAQVQHLKAYASTDALKNTCVDPRFNLVKRGCAPTVIYLGQKENPQGYGWATGAGYGAGILEIMKAGNLI